MKHYEQRYCLADESHFVIGDPRVVLVLDTAGTELTLVCFLLVYAASVKVFATNLNT
jgi:hypothetical protein